MLRRHLKKKGSRDFNTRGGMFLRGFFDTERGYSVMDSGFLIKNIVCGFVSAKRVNYILNINNKLSLPSSATTKDL